MDDIPINNASGQGPVPSGSADRRHPAQTLGTGADPAALALAMPGESFPVLTAFQNLLEQERERGRRRTFALTACFVTALLAMALVFGAVFTIFLGNMMRQNEMQQNRLLDLVARAAATTTPIVAPAQTPPAPQPPPAPPATAEPSPAPTPAASAPAAPAPEPAPSPAPTPAPSAPAAPTPEPAPAASPAPSAPEPSAPATSAPEPALAPTPAPPAVSPQPKRGVLSSPYRKDQEAKLAAEEEARKARIAARKAAEKETPPKRATSSAHSAPAADLPAAADPPPPPPAPAAAQKGARSIHVRQVGASKLPAGTSPDSIIIETPNGAKVPFRTLIPDPPSASK